MIKKLKAILMLLAFFVLLVYTSIPQCYNNVTCFLPPGCCAGYDKQNYTQPKHCIASEIEQTENSETEQTEDDIDIDDIYQIVSQIPEEEHPKHKLAGCTNVSELLQYSNEDDSNTCCNLKYFDFSHKLKHTSFISSSLGLRAPPLA
jgi:hypothetical protein